MSRKVSRLLIMAVAALLVGGLIVGGAEGGNRPAPPKAPPYRIDQNTGQPDLSGLPAKVPIVDNNGNITGYLDKKDLFNENRPRVGPPANQDPGVTVQTETVP